MSQGSKPRAPGALPLPASETPNRSSARFPREHRLRRRADFVRVQGSRHRVTTAHFVLLVDALRSASGNGTDMTSRLGLVVSRKVGNAVVRNRVKRRIREAYRNLGVWLSPGTDLVVIARPSAATLSTAAVSEELSGVASLLRKRTAASREARAKGGGLVTRHGAAS